MRNGFEDGSESPEVVANVDQVRRSQETSTSTDTDRSVSPFIDRLAWLLDESIRIPVIGRRVGIDGAIGMIPGLGDGTGLVASSIVIIGAIQQGVSLPTVVRMVGNVVLESSVGVVPFVGDAFDFIWKSNSRNVRLLRAELADPEHTRRSSIAVLGVSAVAVATLLTVTLVAMLLSLWLLAQAVEAVL